MGGSIISKLAGWKMSDKSNRTTIRSFPGSRVEDMADCVKPTLKWNQTISFCLLVQTTCVLMNHSTYVAEKIVKICEQIEQRSPKTTVAVSELTARHDSIELDQKRKEVNKIIHSFARSRNWKVISHENINSNCLNKRKLHHNYIF
jgi:lipid A disaccharide synthetase